MHLVWKPGHWKDRCEELKAYKAAKDEERKRKGLPPFKPKGKGRSADSLEQDWEKDDENCDLLEPIGGMTADMECYALESEEEYDNEKPNDYDEVN